MTTAVSVANGMLLRGAGFQGCTPGTCSVCGQPFTVGYERRKAYRSRTFVPHCAPCAVKAAIEHREQSLARYSERYGK